jgi:uncharacterized protein YecE (DUF72 family)
VIRSRRRNRGRARVGCSGWQYRHWRGEFYPSLLPQSRWFEHYASVFDTVEINNTFYRLPEQATFAKWAGSAPAGFEFAVKASRFLTHMKKLKDPEEPVERLFSRMIALAPHLGPVLYQLPPGWTVDVDRFQHFLGILPARYRHAVEFRHASWYMPEVRCLADQHGVAICVHDMPGSAAERTSSGAFVYARFHGSSTRYGGSYSDDRLQRWAEWLHDRLDHGCDVYAYFNNDIGGHAPRNALTLRNMLAQRAGAVL